MELWQNDAHLSNTGDASWRFNFMAGINLVAVLPANREKRAEYFRIWRGERTPEERWHSHPCTCPYSREKNKAIGEQRNRWRMRIEGERIGTKRNDDKEKKKLQCGNGDDMVVWWMNDVIQRRLSMFWTRWCLGGWTWPATIGLETINLGCDSRYLIMIDH